MAKKKAKAKKGPRQKDLPGMEDRALKALDNAALRYAEVRDQRMELNKQEVEAKGLVLEMMHKHNKKTYRHGNIAIDIVPEGEKVKVRIKSAADMEESELAEGVEVEEEETESETEDEVSVSVTESPEQAEAAQ